MSFDFTSGTLGCFLFEPEVPLLPITETENDGATAGSGSMTSGRQQEARPQRAEPRPAHPYPACMAWLLQEAAEQQHRRPWRLAVQVAWPFLE